MRFMCFPADTCSGLEAPKHVGSPITAAAWYFDKLREIGEVFEFAKIEVWAFGENVDGAKGLLTCYRAEFLGNGSKLTEIPYEETDIC